MRSKQSNQSINKKSLWTNVTKPEKVKINIVNYYKCCVIFANVSSPYVATRLIGSNNRNVQKLAIMQT